MDLDDKYTRQTKGNDPKSIVVEIDSKILVLIY